MAQDQRYQNVPTSTAKQTRNADVKHVSLGKASLMHLENVTLVLRPDGETMRYTGAGRQANARRGLNRWARAHVNALYGEEDVEAVVTIEEYEK